MFDAAQRLEQLIPDDRIASFARRWKDADSDVDVLVSFDSAATWSLWDLTTMEDELSSLFGRKVDLVEKEGLRNPFRRQHILSGRKVIYVGASLFSRIMRSTELRLTHFDFLNQEPKFLWDSLKHLEIPVLVPHRPRPARFDRQGRGHPSRPSPRGRRADRLHRSDSGRCQ